MIASAMRLLTLMWSDEQARQATIMGFFDEVQQGASREQIDRWLLAMLDAVPGQREALLLYGIDLDTIAWGEVTEFLCSCFYAARRRFAFPDLPTAASEWKDMVAPYPHREKTIKHTVPLHVLPLEERLLALGGKRMVYVGGDEDQIPLLARGQVFEGPAKLVRGEPSRCHTNAARLWREAPSVFSIVTGYALSEDGLWRLHSWLLRKRPTRGQRRLVETTVRRVKYFGFVLSEQEAEESAREAGV